MEIRTILNLVEEIQQLTSGVTAPSPYNSFRILLERLGNPHKNLPPTVHIAGTNGKGSTLAYLNSIMQLAGLRIHRYTSPHLLSICERIQTANLMIREKQLIKHLNQIKTCSENLSLSYFDILTASAFLEFAHTPADYLLLETGMGGRLDPTNVIENPVVTIITQIGMDHIQILGPLMTDIASTKAGIIKPQIPLITYLQDEQIMQIFRQEAQEQNSTMLIADIDQTLQPSLPGRHQIINASLAARAAHELGFASDLIRHAISHTLWPGRMQCLNLLGREVWLDMAHNESAAAVATQSMLDLKRAPFHLIFSLRHSKDLLGFLAPFGDHAFSMTYVPIQASYAHGHSIDAVLEAAPQIYIADNLQDAISRTPPGPILITGSALLLEQALHHSGETAE